MLLELCKKLAFLLYVPGITQAHTPIFATLLWGPQFCVVAIVNVTRTDDITLFQASTNLYLHNVSCYLDKQPNPNMT